MSAVHDPRERLNGPDRPQMPHSETVTVTAAFPKDLKLFLRN